MTRSGYLVKTRYDATQASQAPHHESAQDEAAWSRLPPCSPPEDPNFHQVASVLAYGPWALGKHQCCPRDGRADCSVVDALQVNSHSGRATWFMSWAWGYHFTTVQKALKRWWAKHQIVCGAGAMFGTESTDRPTGASNVYVWWCVFVNNQFRMLEDGLKEEADDLFQVFGGRLEEIGKMLMCMDKLRNGTYTTRTKTFGVVSGSDWIRSGYDCDTIWM